MDFELTQDQQIFYDSVKRFAVNELADGAVDRADDASSRRRALATTWKRNPAVRNTMAAARRDLDGPGDGNHRGSNQR